MTEVKGPTSAPPLPVKVKVPPVWGIAVALRVEVYMPNPNGESGTVRESPLGLVTVRVPGSRPLMDPMVASLR
jgi:hypothetical protein